MSITLGPASRLDLGTNEPYSHITHHPPSRAHRAARAVGRGLYHAGRGAYHAGRLTAKGLYHTGRLGFKAATYGYVGLQMAKALAHTVDRAVHDQTPYDRGSTLHRRVPGAPIIDLD
jgi:hypothetical protein